MNVSAHFRQLTGGSQANTRIGACYENMLPRQITFQLGKVFRRFFVARFGVLYFGVCIFNKKNTNDRFYPFLTLMTS